MTILALSLLALAPAQGGQGGIWDRLSLEAEGRMRGEATFDAVDPVTGNEEDDRFRGRMRFRLGAKYRLTDELNLAGRISTASDISGTDITDANNPYWDWGDGDGFSGATVVIDRYYLDYIANDEVNVVFGKQPHAFASPPIYSDFLWDSDISPAGVAAVWRPKPNGDTSFDARVAGYIAAEDATDDDAKMLGAQGNVRMPVDDINLHLSTAFYDWKDTENAVATTNQGNSALNEDFFVWEVFAAATMPGGPLDEMTGYVQVMRNLDESDNGIVLGAQLGSSKWVQGNYNAYLLLYTLDGDCTFSPVAQDDTPVAGTGLNDGDGDGMDGLVIGGTYFWRENVALKLWALTSSPDGADDDPLRLRFDLDFRIP